MGGHRHIIYRTSLFCHRESEYNTSVEKHLKKSTYISLLPGKTIQSHCQPTKRGLCDWDLCRRVSDCRACQSLVSEGASHIRLKSLCLLRQVSFKLGNSRAPSPLSLSLSLVLLLQMLYLPSGHLSPSPQLSPLIFSANPGGRTYFYLLIHGETKEQAVENNCPKYNKLQSWSINSGLPDVSCTCSYN